MEVTELCSYTEDTPRHVVGAVPAAAHRCLITFREHGAYIFDATEGEVHTSWSLPLRVVMPLPCVLAAGSGPEKGVCFGVTCSASAPKRRKGANTYSLLSWPLSHTDLTTAVSLALDAKPMQLMPYTAATGAHVLIAFDDGAVAMVSDGGERTDLRQSCKSNVLFTGVVGKRDALSVLLLFGDSNGLYIVLVDVERGDEHSHRLHLPEKSTAAIATAALDSEASLLSVLLSNGLWCVWDVSALGDELNPPACVHPMQFLFLAPLSDSDVLSAEHVASCSLGKGVFAFVHRRFEEKTESLVWSLSSWHSRYGTLLQLADLRQAGERTAEGPQVSAATESALAVVVVEGAHAMAMHVLASTHSTLANSIGKLRAQTRRVSSRDLDVPPAPVNYSLNSILSSATNAHGAQGGEQAATAVSEEAWKAELRHLEVVGEQRWSAEGRKSRKQQKKGKDVKGGGKEDAKRGGGKDALSQLYNATSLADALGISYSSKGRGPSDTVLNHFISRCIAEERWIPFRALLMRARVSASVHGAAILKLMRTQHVGVAYEAIVYLEAMTDKWLWRFMRAAIELAHPSSSAGSDAYEAFIEERAMPRLQFLIVLLGKPFNSAVMTQLLARFSSLHIETLLVALQDLMHLHAEHGEESLRAVMRHHPEGTKSEFARSWCPSLRNIVGWVAAVLDTRLSNLVLSPFMIRTLKTLSSYTQMHLQVSEVSQGVSGALQHLNERQRVPTKPTESYSIERISF